MTCMNCGSDRVEVYCSHCGQRVHRPPFAIRPLLRQAVDDLFNVDRGLLHTVVTLTRRPGWTVAEYVGGRTRPFTNPAKYLVVCVAIATLAFHYSGMMATQLEWMGMEAVTADGPGAVAIEFANRYFNILMIAGVPFMAVFSRLFFSRAGYTFAEHLIFNVFIYAHQSLLLAATIPVYLLVPDAGLYLVLWTMVVVLYYVWACWQFFRVSLFAAAVRAVLVTACTYLVFGVVIGSAMALVVRAFYA